MKMCVWRCEDVICYMCTKMCMCIFFYVYVYNVLMKNCVFVKMCRNVLCMKMCMCN